MIGEVELESDPEGKEQTLLGTQRQLLGDAMSGREHIFADLGPEYGVPLEFLGAGGRLDLGGLLLIGAIHLLVRLLAEFLRGGVGGLVVLGLDHLDLSDGVLLAGGKRLVLAETFPPVVDVGVVEGGARAVPVQIVLRSADL